MMYLLFSKKQQGDLSVFPTTKLAANFYKFLKSKELNVFLIGIPGYISTMISTIDRFYNNFCKLCGGNNIEGYFLKPLNICKVNRLMTNIDYLNYKFGNYQTIYSGKKDHSKILLFVDRDCLSFDGKRFDIDFTKPMVVYGALLGSSNQSYNTYFGFGKKGIADKGEADVLIINDNIKFYDRIICDNDALDFYNGMDASKLILAKQMIRSATNLNNYLKEIFLIEDVVSVKGDEDSSEKAKRIGGF